MNNKFDFKLTKEFVDDSKRKISCEREKFTELFVRDRL